MLLDFMYVVIRFMVERLPLTNYFKPKAVLSLYLFSLSVEFCCKNSFYHVYLQIGTSFPFDCYNIHTAIRKAAN